MKNNNFFIGTDDLIKDDKLNDFQVILMMKITALSQEKGYAFCSNNYLSELFNKNKPTISKNINYLIKNGYLQASYDSANNRRLHITKFNNTYYENSEDPVIKNHNTPIIKNHNHNNKDLNIKNNNKEKNKQKEYFEDSKINQLFLDFLEERTLNKKKATPKAVDRLINKLKTYPQSDWEEIIDNSIMNGWTGLFPLKKNVIINQKKEEEVMRKFNKRYSISKNEHYYVRLRDGKEFTIEQFKKEKERLLNESN